MADGEVGELDPYYAPLGPFFDDAGAMRALGNISSDALRDQRENRTLLAVQTGDGSWLYPAWQFTQTGRIEPRLVPVLDALRRMDRWGAGMWLVSSHPDLEGRSPREALRDGVGPDAVARLASHDQVDFGADA